MINPRTSFVAPRPASLRSAPLQGEKRGPQAGLAEALWSHVPPEGGVLGTEVLGTTKEVLVLPGFL